MPSSDEEGFYPTSVQLSAVVTYSDGTTNSSVTWTSYSFSIAFVDHFGLVTASGLEGTATIVATSPDGMLSQTVSVRVVDSAAYLPF